MYDCLLKTWEKIISSMKVSLKLESWNQKAKAKYIGGEVIRLMQSSSMSRLLTPLPQIHNVFPGPLQLSLLGPALVVECPFVEIFKTQLNMVLGNLPWLPLLEQGGWTRWSPEVPANLNHSVMNRATTKLIFKPRLTSERLSVNLMLKEETVKAIGFF